MKRKFTFLMAALTLLSFLVPITGWGQTSTDFEFYLNQLYQNGTLVTAKTVITENGGTLTFTDQNENFTILLTRNSGNQPGFYTSSGYIRFYTSDTFKLSAADGITMTKIVVTPNGTSFSVNAMDGLNATTMTWEGTASEVTFTGSGTNKWDKLTITYSSGSGSQLTQSNLALTNAPVELEFDLYSNSAAQVINYTTSSTGAVTVSASDYITTVVDESNKTITVTPVAVTPSAQTITVNQAADDTYAAGSVTFTVNVANSEPTPDYEWVLTDWSELTSEDVFVIVGNGTKAMGNYASSSNPKAVNVTITDGRITSNVTDTMMWNRSAVDGGYKLHPNGSTTTCLYNSSGTNLRVNGGTSNNTFTYVEYSNNKYLKVGDRFVCIYNNNNDWRAYTSSNVSSNATNTTFYKRQIASTDPYITASDVEIAYDATSGSFDFTLNNPVDGGQLSVEENVDWIEAAAINTSNGYSVTFETTVNQTATAREGIITLTYSYNNNSETITKEVTITQAGNPNVFDNISDITEVNHAYTVRGTVVATNAKGFIMGDGTGYVYYYKGSTVSQSVGNKVKVSGTTGTYGQIIQFTSTASVSEATSSNYNNTPAAEVITAVPDYSTGYHLSTYLEFEGALSTATGNNNTTNYLITLGDAQIQISYPTTAQTTALSTLVGKNVHVKGYFSGINSSEKFSVMMESVEDLTPVTPVINADNVTLLYDATSGEIAYTISNPVTGVALEATTDAEWIDNITVGEASVTFTCSANEGTEDRTASFTLTYEGAENKVVNVTQGHYVVDYASLPFTWAGGLPDDFNALNGTTLYSVGSYPNTNQAPYQMKLDATGDYIQVKTNEQPGIVTVGVKMIGGATTSKIVVQGSSDGVDFNNAIDTLVVSGNQNDTLVLETTHDFANTDRYVRLYFIKGSNVGVGPISIAQFDNTPSISASDVEIEYDVISGAIAYTINRPVEGGVLTASVPDGSWITLGTIDETVPFTCTANTTNTARTATVTLTYTYGEESVNKDVTVTQAAAPTPSLTLAPDVVNVSAEGGQCGFDITFANMSGNITVSNVYYYPVEPTQGYDWISMVNGVATFDVDSIYFTLQPNTTTESRSVEIKLVINGVESNLVTVTQAAPFAPTVYTKVTSITPGQHYIIVGYNNDDAYAMGGQNTNNRAAIVVSDNGNTAVVTKESVAEFVIESVGDFYSINDGTGYLYAASGSSNQLKTETELDNNGKWEITFNAEDGQADVVAQGSNSRRYMRFNYGNNPIFSCYAESSSVKAKVYFFVKSIDVPPTYNTTISSTDFSATIPAGYRLIASPANNIDPQDVVGMLGGGYDLYAFDENGKDNNNELKEWRNYKAQSFLLESGKGYLYASENGVDLNFVGAPYAGDGVVTLKYTEGNRFAGWNLIGNPFASAASLDLPYYKLNEQGSALIPETETTSISIMEGVFVYAYDETEQQAIAEANFTVANRASETQGAAKFDVNVMSNNVVIDRAIVRFDAGRTLPKFQFNGNSTKVYIPQGNKDFAVVRSANEGEMPVNFKAETNGNYTLSVNAENVDMNYLHLIDNMTGADVDLLATPSYSFEANTNDYATRFRLVFKANADITENADAETFAFFNGSEWVVSNMGEATLQVVDVMGRVLSSETINGNAELSLNQVPGVYMLRLVNGDNVKVQKVVVR